MKISEMRIYWLHILEHKSPSPRLGVPSTYTLARANAPERNATGSAMPTVHYPSWSDLSAALVRVGVNNDVLQDGKANLDLEGSYTITEVHLSDDQLTQLGFVNVEA